MLTNTARYPNRTSVLIELVVITTLAVLFLVFFTGRPGYIDVVLGLVAVALIAASTRRTREIWRQVRRTNPDARAASRWMMIFTCVVVALFLVIGTLEGYAADGWRGAWERIGNWHLLVACALYFPWALLQQFVFQFYLLGRIRWVLPYWPAIFITAIAYSGVHFPRVPVMIGTVFAGVVWGATYHRYGKLLPLAVSHAILGSTLHYWVLGRDLWLLWS